MKKNAIIIVLAFIALAQWIYIYNMPKRIDYWLQRTIAAEDVIYRVYEDNDTYVLDVLSEGSEWDTWISLAGQQERLG